MNPNEARALIGLPPYPGGEKYGSPAINPAGADPNENSPSSAGKTPKSAQSVADKAHEALLHAGILHLLEMESHNLMRAAKTAGNFVNWLDDFYTAKNSKFDKLCASVLGPSITAARSVGIIFDAGACLWNYAKHRHASALEACSNVTVDELPEAIEKLINSQTELVAQGLLATALGSTEWESE